MLRYYQTINNLGGDITANLMFDQPVDMVSAPDPQFDIVSGYSNIASRDGLLTVTNSGGINYLSFNGSDLVPVNALGLYILFSPAQDQQIVVDVTSLTVTATTLAFTMASVTNLLFDPIDTQLAIDGGDRYRCYAIKNEDPTLSFTGGKLWIALQVAVGSISIGLDPSGVSGIPTTSDGTTPPVGVLFTTPLDEASGIVLPVLNPADYLFVWVKRTNPPGTLEDIYRYQIEESGSYV